MNKLVEAALSYANKGYYVFPCKVKSKEPATPNGFKDATTDEEVIREWWRREPNYNIGIRTGPSSGLLVIDVDGEDGKRTQIEWRQGEGKQLPYTATVKTSNGTHVYLKHPGIAVGNTIKRVPGIDVREDGGYVLAPPSIHPDSGEAYRWAYTPEKAGVADTPKWLLDKLIRPSRSPSRAPVQETIPEGSRNGTLFSKARSLFRQGYGESEVYALLEQMNRNRCLPPLDSSEVVQIMKSAGSNKYDRGELRVSKDTEGVGVIMADVQAETVEWLWQDRIPLGKLTILDGDPSLGKSVITMDLAARVTTGTSFPNGNVGDVDHVGNLDHLDHLGGVVILSAEDGLADTIKPRLDAAGADTSRIVAISTVPDGKESERTIAIPEDIVTIEAAIRRVDAKLVIIDPLMAFLSGEAHKDQDVRKALTPLARMAEATGVAVLVVRHLNKQQGGKAIYRGGSSIGIIGAARSGLVVEEHPDNKDLRVLAMNKSNLAVKAASLTYSITTAGNESAKVLWGSATGLDADDILNPDTSEVGKAMAWLADKLRDVHLPSNTVFEEGREAGFSKKTIQRAKDALGVKAKKDGLGGTWRWHLEDGQGSQDGQDSQDGQRKVVGLAS